uniref:Uncharacterized protein n=1 Tax=Arundo donax TaxID=35708 RepID=A0A0A9H390_ARUDO
MERSFLLYYKKTPASVFFCYYLWLNCHP